MGNQAIPAKMLGNVPLYYVTDTVQEDAGGGNIRIFNYARINGVLVPQFQCIVASSKLVTISRMMTNVAQDVFSYEQLRVSGQHVH